MGGRQASKETGEVRQMVATSPISPYYTHVEGKIKNFKLDKGSKNKKAGKQGNS